MGFINALLEMFEAEEVSETEEVGAVYTTVILFVTWLLHCYFGNMLLEILVQNLHSFVDI